MFQAARKGRGCRHHHRVVNIGDDPDGDRRVDDEDGRIHTLCLVSANGDRVPAGREVDFEHSVDHSAAICNDALFDVPDFYRDCDVTDGHAGETAPSADLLVTRVCSGGGFREQNPAKHPRPARCAVAGVRHDGRDLPPASGVLLPKVVHRIFGTCCEVEDRLCSCNRG